MYNFPQYIEKDQEKVIAFMRAHPFVTLIAVDKSGRTEATQIPVLMEEREGKVFLQGHVARKTEHHIALTENPEALFIFTSPHTYVSATWYTGNPYQGSTWNYVSVHARGKINWLNEDGLIQLLRKLSLHFENYNKDASTVYDNLPDDYKLKLLKAIEAFEVEITELDNVFKLSQNRDEASYDNIVKKLKEQGGAGSVIGEWMEERKSNVFDK